MEKIVDYPSEELKKEEKTKTRKIGKHDRIKKMLYNIAEA